MSAIDDEICDFFNKKATLDWELRDAMNWITEYESFRYEYPDWINKDGIHMKIYDITDSHLTNLIAFVSRNDNENKTHWVDVFEQERKYRILKKRISEIKAELDKMEEVIDKCF